MKISSLIQEESGSTAAIARRDEVNMEERKQAHSAAYDTVSISPEARERFEVKEAGEAGDRKGDPGRH